MIDVCCRRIQWLLQWELQGPLQGIGVVQVPQRGGTGRRTLQADSPHEGKSPAAERMLPEPMESDSEGSMPLIDSGNESDMEDASS